MKKMKIFFLLAAMPLIYLLNSCNNSSDAKVASSTDTKVVSIPASSKSAEAVTSFQQGLAAFDLGDTKKAKALFNKAIEQDPKFGLAYLYRANLQFGNKEFADDIASAKANMEGASNWEKMNAELFSTFLSGDRQKQLEISQKIASEYPDAARAHVDLGNTYSGNNQYDKARESYQKAIQLDPKWPGAYIAQANSYLFNDPKDLKKAEENALKVVELAPASPGAQILLGDCYRAQNDFQKAKDAYAKAVTLDPAEPGGYYKVGHADTYLGNMEEARKNFTAGAAHDDDAPTSQATTSIAYTYLYSDGDYKTALKTLMDGAATLGNDPKGKLANQKNNFLSNCANIAAHFGDAATLKQLVPTLTALSEQTNNDLGTAEGKIFAKATSLYWQALSAITEGKYDEAKAKAEEMKAAEESIKDDRKLEGYHYLLGQISMKQKNYADATGHFEKADQNDIYNKYCMAKANEAAGNKDKAMALYKEVAAYNFNDLGNALVRAEVKKKLATP